MIKENGYFKQESRERQKREGDSFTKVDKNENSDNNFNAKNIL